MYTMTIKYLLSYLFYPHPIARKMQETELLLLSDKSITERSQTNVQRLCACLANQILRDKDLIVVV